MRTFKRWLVSLAACLGVLVVYAVLRVGLNRVTNFPLHTGSGEIVVLIGMAIILRWVTKAIMQANPRNDNEPLLPPGKPKSSAKINVLFAVAAAAACWSIFIWQNINPDSDFWFKEGSVETLREERQASPIPRPTKVEKESTKSETQDFIEIVRSAQDSALDQSLNDMRETRFQEITALFPQGSRKIEFQIKYPISWQVRERVRPDILFKINHPEACFPVMSRGVFFDDESQEDLNNWKRNLQAIDEGNSVPESLYTDVLPKGATTISAYRRSVDSQPALDLICEVTQNAAGIEVFLVKRFFFIPYNGHLITLEASYGYSGSEMSKDEIRERFFEANKLYSVIFMTAVFLDRYK